MQLHEALRDGPSYLRNASEIAQRTPVNADTLYMWDNQVTAIELFLAGTEDLNGQDASLTTMRKELFGLKRQIEQKVLEFELKQENQEVPPEPAEQDLLDDMKAYAQELLGIVKQLRNVQVNSFKDLQELEDPLQQFANFCVETEPLKGKDAKLDQSRNAIKKFRGELEQKCALKIKELQSQETDDGDD